MAAPDSPAIGAIDRQSKAALRAALQGAPRKSRDRGVAGFGRRVVGIQISDMDGASRTSRLRSPTVLV